MGKDEMKNRISMALKDPILQQGFEVICKENSELKSLADFQIWSNIDNYHILKRSKEQLTKAKEIIKDYMIVATGGHITVCSVPEDNHCIDVLKLNEQAEQFLKDSDIDGAIKQANEGLDFDKIADEIEQDLKDSEVGK